MNQNDELKNKAESKLTDDEVSKVIGGLTVRGAFQCPHCRVAIRIEDYSAHVAACKARERNRQENNDGPDLTVPGTMDPV